MQGQRPLQRQRSVVNVGSSSFSPIVLVLCWFCFVALHLFCLLYFAAVAWCYWHLPGTSLDRWLYTYKLGLGTTHDQLVAIAHGCVAGIHLGYLVWMISWSIKERQLVFAVYDVFVDASKRSTGEDQPDRSLYGFSRDLIAKIVLVGVDGPYFDVVLLGREIVETALQTQQAYRMSLLLPRTQLNRSYTALLVLNCWATALVHTAFHGSATKRRFYAIVCDCTLDMVTSVGVSVVLIAIYFPQFDFEINDFPLPTWYEDVWVVHAMSEFQILLVTSSGDLIMRMIFSLSLVSNMSNMKKLLSTTSETKAFKRNVNHRVASVFPRSPSLAVVHAAHRPDKWQVVVQSAGRLTQVIFGAWGALILVLHLYAESISSIPQCGMQIKPWFISQSSCSLLMLDCHEQKLAGYEDEITVQWSSVDPQTVACVVVRHCPELEVSPKLTEFSSLKMLKLYNSTIKSWGERAAISQKHHPNLIMLFLVRVNMTNGELPAGLQADDFPEELKDIEFCVTNLQTLPTDLDLKWPQFASIYLEACNFTEVPASLARLAPFDLSLAFNPIVHLPSTIFEGSVVYFHAGGTLISDLPEDVNNVLPLAQLRVDNTNVSFFWDWIDPVVENAADVLSDLPVTVVASGSPYCSDLQRIYNGDQTSFSAAHEGQSQLLSDASVENWPALRNIVSCDEWPRTWYPLQYEDVYSGVKVT